MEAVSSQFSVKNNSFRLDAIVPASTDRAPFARYLVLFFFFSAGARTPLTRLTSPSASLFFVGADIDVVAKCNALFPRLSGVFAICIQGKVPHDDSLVTGVTAPADREVSTRRCLQWLDCLGHSLRERHPKGC